MLLISGLNLVMDAWDPTYPKGPLLNHTVVIFDNRGVGNTTAGTKPFSIVQFVNDTAGLLDEIENTKSRYSWIFYGFFYSSRTCPFASRKS